MHAPIFACARDIANGVDEEHVKKWYIFFLSMTVCLVQVKDKEREVKAPFEAIGRCCRCLDQLLDARTHQEHPVCLPPKRRETFGRVGEIGSPNRARAILP